MTRHRLAIVLAALTAAGCDATDRIAPSRPESRRSNVRPPLAPLGSMRPTDGPSGADHAVVNSAMRDELVGTTRLQGGLITDVRMIDQCRTRFETGKTAVEIDWSTVGNYAAREKGGVVTIPIPDARGTHVFTMPDGDMSRGMDGAMGLLASDCEAVDVGEAPVDVDKPGI